MPAESRTEYVAVLFCPGDRQAPGLTPREIDLPTAQTNGTNYVQDRTIKSRRPAKTGHRKATSPILQRAAFPKLFCRSSPPTNPNFTPPPTRCLTSVQVCLTLFNIKNPFQKNAPVPPTFVNRVNPVQEFFAREPENLVTLPEDEQLKPEKNLKIQLRSFASPLRSSRSLRLIKPLKPCGHFDVFNPNTQKSFVRRPRTRGHTPLHYTRS